MKAYICDLCKKIQFKEDMEKMKSQDLIAYYNKYDYEALFNKCNFVKMDLCQNCYDLLAKLIYKK